MLMLQIKIVTRVWYHGLLMYDMLGTEVTLPALTLMLANTMHHVLHGLKKGVDKLQCLPVAAWQATSL